MLLTGSDPGGGERCSDDGYTWELGFPDESEAELVIQRARCGC